MTKSMHRVLASLKLPSSAPALVLRAREIVAAVNGNTWFPKPSPPLAKVRVAIDKLQKAAADALRGTIGLHSRRDDEQKALVDLLTRLKAYVQGIANDNPEHAAAIIESAAMFVVGRKTRPRPILEVLRGPVSGSVKLVAKAVAKQASYLWERSEDGGKTWVRIRRTQQANTVADGLVPGTRYGFRFQAVTARYTTNPCDPVFYVVQ